MTFFLKEGFNEFELTCNGDEVVGPEGGTGEGYSDIFGIYEAEIKSAAQRSAEECPVIVSEVVGRWCED